MSNKQDCKNCKSQTCPSRERDANETEEQYQSRIKLAERLSRIDNKIIVLSGKGGVGKSTIAANLAQHLAAEGHQVGLLDIDLHGPSVPHFFGMQEKNTLMDNEEIVPVMVGPNLKVMSIAFLLESNDDALIWRGPMKIGVIQQLLRDTNWGDLDYLIVDCPPGTGDEPLSAAQTLVDGGAAVIVTTPQEVAISDVRKSITFCRKVGLPVLGVIENMNGFVCPKCNEVTNIFDTGGGEKMCKDMGVPFLGSLPLDPAIMQSANSGRPHAYYNASTPSGKAMAAAFEPLQRPLKGECPNQT